MSALEDHFNTPKQKEITARVAKVKRECKDIFELTKFFSEQYGGTWGYDGEATWFDDENLRWIVRFGEKYSIHDPKIDGGVRRITFSDGVIREVTA